MSGYRYVVVTAFRHGPKDRRKGFDRLTVSGQKVMRQAFQHHLEPDRDQIAEIWSSEMGRTQEGAALGREVLNLNPEVQVAKVLGYAWVDRVNAADVPGFLASYEALEAVLGNGVTPTVGQVLEHCPRARVIKQFMEIWLLALAKRLVGSADSDNEDNIHVAVVSHDPNVYLPSNKPERRTTGMGEAVRYWISVPLEDPSRTTISRVEFLDDPEDKIVAKGETEGVTE